MFKKLFLLLSVAVTLAGCANGFQQFYRPISSDGLQRIYATRVAPAPSVPAVERGSPSDPQETLASYRKKGYALIGSAVFNSGRPPSDAAAVEQGKDVGADLVLILDPHYTGSVTSSVPFTLPTSTNSFTTGSATAYGAGGTVNAYGNSTTTTYGSQTTYVPITINRSDYGAVFFVKQKFRVGLFTRDLNDAERQKFQTNKGLIVTDIVDGTPSFSADILPGDRITAIDGREVQNAADFHRTFQNYPGSQPVFSIERGGVKIEKSLQL